MNCMVLVRSNEHVLSYTYVDPVFMIRVEVVHDVVSNAIRDSPLLHDFVDLERFVLWFVNNLS